MERHGLHNAKHTVNLHDIDQSVRKKNDKIQALLVKVK